jgi:DNA-binding HxlR family transcriptional regulator
MRAGYGQYCPIAKGAEVFAERWTPLIVRNLALGAHTFSEIAAGCPRMSTTLLVQRLRSLERAGVVEKRVYGGRRSHYDLTDAGRELAAVTTQLGNWGARWLELAPADYDPSVVLWAWKMGADLERLPQPRVVVSIELQDRPRQRFWLLLQKPAAEVCIRHPGFDEDVAIVTDSRTLIMIRLGRMSIAAAEHEGRWRADGARRLVRGLTDWGGLLSSFAGVQRDAGQVAEAVGVSAAP